MQNLTVKDLMAENPIFVDLDDTLEDAAVEMRVVDCGVLPVGNRNNVKGVITDRDIVIRAIAKGKDPAKERVRNYMTSKAFFCKEDDSITDAANVMGKNKIGRLIVRDDAGRVSGILSFGHILRESISAADIANLVSSVVGKRKKAA